MLSTFKLGKIYLCNYAVDNVVDRPIVVTGSYKLKEDPLMRYKFRWVDEPEKEYWTDELWANRCWSEYAESDQDGQNL